VAHVLRQYVQIYVESRAIDGGWLHEVVVHQQRNANIGLLSKAFPHSDAQSPFQPRSSFIQILEVGKSMLTCPGLMLMVDIPLLLLLTIIILKFTFWTILQCSTTSLRNPRSLNPVSSILPRGHDAHTHCISILIPSSQSCFPNLNLLKEPQFFKVNDQGRLTDLW
jgi:hypothetical protein